MRFITTLALNLVARNIHSLIDFIAGLDDRLEAFIDSHSNEMSVIDEEIADLRSKRFGVLTAQRTAANLKAGLANLRG